MKVLPVSRARQPRAPSSRAPCVRQQAAEALELLRG